MEEEKGIIVYGAEVYVVLSYRAPPPTFLSRNKHESTAGKNKNNNNCKQYMCSFVTHHPHILLLLLLFLLFLSFFSSFLDVGGSPYLFMYLLW